MKVRISRIVLLVVMLSFIVSAGSSAAVRTGAWVDEVVFVEETDPNKAIARIEAGELDIYTLGIAQADLVKQIQSSPKLDYEISFGSYNELTLNPAGPIFDNGKLNPFAVPAIREALNWLIDRDYISAEVFGGLGVARYTPLNTAFPDYARYADVIRQLELKYAYDPAKAKEVITAEMQKLGAALVNGKWTYKGEQVTLIFLIRPEDERRQVGDYIASQLETVGFVVDRQYKTSAEAAPLWNAGDPKLGQWHLYTGGWTSTLVNRDLADNFSFFHTKRGMASPLWMAYEPDPTFDKVAERLSNGDFSTADERRELFAQALEMAFKDSVRIWLNDRISIWPRSANVTMATDVGAGMSASWIWGLTIRRDEGIGGKVSIGNTGMLVEPWNPVAGTNWLYDNMIIRGTGETGVMPDPFTGLYRPQRVEKAEVYHLEGLPVMKSLDWVDLTFVKEINVPGDTWVDWDAKNQQFIPVAQKYPEGLSAKTKVVVHFAKNLFTDVKWHDGSTLSMGDILLRLILSFDRAKPESAIYDESAVPDFEAFMQTFKGVRIIQTNPLVVEYYTDTVALDAEYVAEDAVYLFWPYMAQGPASWHALALGIKAETAKELAFSKSKADLLKVEWMNYIAGPSLNILNRHMEAALAETYLPYAGILGKYVSADEITARYNNIKNWYASKRHFWLGTGALYLDQVRTVEKIAVLKRFEAFPDAADKWAGFSSPPIASVQVVGANQVRRSAGANFTVNVTFDGEPYAVKDVDFVKYMVFDSRDNLVLVDEATAVKDGEWRISLSAADAAKIPIGTARIELAVSPIAVSIPAFGNIQFVVLP